MSPDVSALRAPPIGWMPAIDVAQLTIVRPVPWARRVDDIPFRPEHWGERALRISALGGDQWLIRRAHAPELALWVPHGLAPRRGRAFGLFLAAQHDLARRAQAAQRFRRAIGFGAPLAAAPFADVRRHAIMLYLFDARRAGASLRDMAAELLGAAPPDWRTSSVRSDLRRLAETAELLAARNYRKLLR